MIFFYINNIFNDYVITLTFGGSASNISNTHIWSDRFILHYICVNFFPTISKMLIYLVHVFWKSKQIELKER